MIAWLARWRRRRADARWRRIEIEAAAMTARLGPDAARMRALETYIAQLGPHPLSGEAVGGSTAPDASRAPPTLTAVLARPENCLRDQRSVR